MIEINNLTEVQIDDVLVKKNIERVLEKENKPGAVSVAFIGPGRMRKLNKKFFSRNRVTDVLSFAEQEVKFGKFAIEGLKKSDNLGEIVVCLREVKKNSQRNKTDFEKELIKVLIHGTLHLLGYDHEKGEKEAEKMREKEENYLSPIIDC